MAGPEHSNKCRNTVAESSSTESYPWAGASVLLVEDNLANQQLGTVVMQKFGLQVDVVDNGLEAIEALKNKSYSLVFMDLQMPVMDGLEATIEIRNPDSDVIDHGITIVALTANAFSSDKKRCFEVGMNDYVSKPFTPDLIQKVLEKFLIDNTPENPNNNAAARHFAERPKVGRIDISSNDIADGYDGLPVYDHDSFMDRIMCDQKLMTIVLDGFLSDIPEQISKLKSLIESGDVTAAGRQSHSIKGAAANVGGKALRAICLFLEIAGKEGRLAQMSENISTLELEFVKLSGVLREVLEKTKTEEG